MHKMSPVSRHIAAALILSLFACATAACGSDDDDEPGKVNITAYGEEYIEEGISADDMNDDWEISFDSFIVRFEEIKIGNQTFTGPKSIELAKISDGEGFPVATLDEVEGGEHKDPEFIISELTITGSATKNEVTKSFSWVFTDRVKYSECEATIQVSGDSDADFEITVHADHLFSDSLVSSEPTLLFGPLAAADADDDGTITEDELKEAGIGAYDVGNEDIDNLWDFVRAQSNHLGHVNGEGHCKSEVL